MAVDKSIPLLQKEQVYGVQEYRLRIQLRGTIPSYFYPPVFLLKDDADTIFALPVNDFEPNRDELLQVANHGQSFTLDAVIQPYCLPPGNYRFHALQLYGNVSDANCISAPLENDEFAWTELRTYRLINPEVISASEGEHQASYFYVGEINSERVVAPGDMVAPGYKP